MLNFRNANHDNPLFLALGSQKEDCYRHHCPDIRARSIFDNLFLDSKFKLVYDFVFNFFARIELHFIPVKVFFLPILNVLMKSTSATPFFNV